MGRQCTDGRRSIVIKNDGQSLLSVTYPNGKSVYYNMDLIGRLESLTSAPLTAGEGTIYYQVNRYLATGEISLYSTGNNRFLTSCLYSFQGRMRYREVRNVQGTILFKEEMGYKNSAYYDGGGALLSYIVSGQDVRSESRRLSGGSSRTFSECFG